MCVFASFFLPPFVVIPICVLRFFYPAKSFPAGKTTVFKRSTGNSYRVTKFACLCSAALMIQSEILAIVCNLFYTLQLFKLYPKISCEMYICFVLRPLRSYLEEESIFKSSANIFDEYVPSAYEIYVMSVV